MPQVNAVMTSNPARCQRDTAIAAVAQLMVDNDCGEIPVVDAQDQPVGVITDRDIVVRLIAGGRDVSSATVGDAMTAPAHTIRDDAELGACVELMEAQRIRRVPVVDGSGRLTGMVSLADIALANKDQATAQVVKEVSRPGGNG